MGCDVGCDVGAGLREFLLWLVFDPFLSIEGEVDIAGVRRKGVHFLATFFSDEVDEGNTSLVNVIPSTSETLKTMGRDIQGLRNGWLGRILLGGPENESQG